MYRGDGSYLNSNKSEYDLEYSLLELLENEKNLVIEYNNAIQAYNSAIKLHIRTNDCVDKIKYVKSQLDALRANISSHCAEKLGLKNSLGESLYDMQT